MRWTSKVSKDSKGLRMGKSIAKKEREKNGFSLSFFCNAFSNVRGVRRVRRVRYVGYIGYVGYVGYAWYIGYAWYVGYMPGTSATSGTSGPSGPSCTCLKRTSGGEDGI